ncbi:GIY-YIG nuclease family protein [Paraburkholderia sp. ZP32-5]|uniref:GIY-YIG nuclease family protein n=1 Tax=Paraburkholderia sp. ZP32-5 TaxID=2883245 RepID=UPI001F436817|nr:GIY-YIG nuclease family protein [Paraburkholderia sp. ZP32-5]
MGYINFDLTNSGSLSTLASAGAGMAGTLPVGMPATGGLYLIYHQANNNRYIGKSGDLRQRFDGRMLTVNEFGLSPANLANLGVFWSEVDAWNTPAPVMGVAAPLVNTLIAPIAPAALGFQVIRNAGGAAPPMPNAVVGTPGGVINYGGAQVTTMVDGLQINVEALLIRFFRQAIGVGGSITNGVYMGPFTNPTNHELIVQVEWGACPVVNIPAAHYCITIPAHGQF